jgi:hypothetical protein
MYIRASFLSFNANASDNLFLSPLPSPKSRDTNQVVIELTVNHVPYSTELRHLKESGTCSIEKRRVKLCSTKRIIIFFFALPDLEVSDKIFLMFKLCNVNFLYLFFLYSFSPLLFSEFP